MNHNQDIIFTDDFVGISSSDDSILQLDEASNPCPNISTSVTTYLEKIGQVPLLKPEQERALFAKLELKKALLEKILSQLQNAKFLSSEYQEKLSEVFTLKRRRAKGAKMTISPETLGRLQDLIADWKVDIAMRFPDKWDVYISEPKLQEATAVYDRKPLSEANMTFVLAEDKAIVDTDSGESLEKRSRNSHLEEFAALFNELQVVVKSIQDIQQHLVEANLLLVASIAKQFSFSEFPLSFLDLMQEGSIGLMTAIHKFRLEKGHRFSTYATWWISQAIRRALDEQGQLIRVPTYIIEIRRRATKASSDLKKRLGREPRIGELAEAINITKSKLCDVLQAPKDLLSLDSPISADSETTIADLLNDEMTASPEEEIFRQAEQEIIENLLSTLTSQQASVIKLRYGLFDGKCHTLAEIGRKLKITRERVRQIESEAIKKLRHPTRQRYWKELLE